MEKDDDNSILIPYLKSLIAKIKGGSRYEQIFKITRKSDAVPCASG